MISKRKQKELRKKKIWGFFYIGLALLITSIIVTPIIIQQKETKKIDGQTNCPIVGSPEYISIIFDKSDSFNSKSCW